MKGPHREFNCLQTTKKSLFSVSRAEGCEMQRAYSVTVVLQPYIDGTEYPIETPVGYKKQVLA